MRARLGALPLLAAAALALSFSLMSREGGAETAAGGSADAGVTVDYVAVRFYASETGGPEHPRFITERMLSFEAHIEALTEQLGTTVEERHVRAAVEHHIAEEMLSSLPIDPKPTAREVTALQQVLLGALCDRIGGEDALARLAVDDGIGESEVDAMMNREARAAIYLDRAVSPILHPTEEQLRTVFRTSAHPYRNGKSFEAVRGPLERWFVSERVHVAEQGFLQTARTRVKSFAIQR